MARDPGARTDRLIAADRAKERAAEAGERVAALRRRRAELQEASDPAQSLNELPSETLAKAETRRDEAAQRDRAAHDAAARAHDRAADTYALLAVMASPPRDADFLTRAQRHRDAAKKDREHGEGTSELPAPAR